VRDLEAVRQALGGPKLDLVGGSYGTRVALEYLRRHPEAVRTVVLDSPVRRSWPCCRITRRTSTMRSRGFSQPAGDARVREALRRSGPHARAAARAAARRAAAARIHDPMTHVARDESLTEPLLGSVVRLYAYQSEAAALLPLLLDEAAHGRPEPLLAQAELIFQRLSEESWHGMELSVICSEDEPFLKERKPIGRR